MKIKRVIQWLAQRSVFVVAVLLFAVFLILVWFLIAGFAPTNERILVSITAIATFFAAVSAIASLLQAVESQKQRQSQERPYVTAFFDGASNGLINFVVQNLGNSPAIGVRFKFDPSPVDFAGRTLSEVSLFANPISFLPPGKMMRQIVDMGYRLLTDGKPTKYTVTVSYSSIYHEDFEETVEHDLEYLKQSTLPPKTIEDQLNNISEHLKSLSQTFRNASNFDSILVQTPDQLKERVERQRENQNDVSE